MPRSVCDLAVCRQLAGYGSAPMQNHATPPTDGVTPTLRRLRGWMDADTALRLMNRGRVRAGGYTLAPSGADALACMLARALLGHCEAAALALPRGETLL